MRLHGLVNLVKISLANIFINIYKIGIFWDISSCDYWNRQIRRSAKWVNKLKTQESQWFSFSPSPKLWEQRANGVVPIQRLRGTRPPNVQFFIVTLKAGKKLITRLEGSQERMLSESEEGQTFCSVLAFNWLDEIYPYKGEQSALFSLPV